MKEFTTQVWIQSSALIVLEIISTHSSICGFVMVKGGARRMMSPCVGFAKSPLSRRRKHTSHASKSETHALLNLINSIESHSSFTSSNNDGIEKPLSTDEFDDTSRQLT